MSTKEQIHNSQPSHLFCRPPCQRLWKDEFKQCCVANKNIKFKLRPIRTNIWRIYDMRYQERNPRNRMFQKVKKSEEEIEDGSVTGCGCQEFLIRLLLSNWTVTHNTSIYFCKNHKTNALRCFAGLNECCNYQIRLDGRLQSNLSDNCNDNLGYTE